MLPGFWVFYTGVKQQGLVRKSMICQYFWEENVTRISRNVQNIPQGLRDTLR